MRKLAVALLGCLMLTGCGASWEAQVHFRIVSLNQSSPTEWFVLEPVGEGPKGVLEAGQLNGLFMHKSEVNGSVAVGDEVVCSVRQEKGSAVGNAKVKTYLDDCEKA